MEINFLKVYLLYVFCLSVYTVVYMLFVAYTETTDCFNQIVLAISRVN